MTVLRKYFVSCDVCSTASIEVVMTAVRRSTGAAQSARLVARKSGWVRRDQRDMCPSCRIREVLKNRGERVDKQVATQQEETK